MSRSKLRERSRWRYWELRYYVHQTCSVLLHYDNSERCVCPLYKFVYSFKVAKLFLKHPIYRRSSEFHLRSIHDNKTASSCLGHRSIKTITGRIKENQFNNIISLRLFFKEKFRLMGSSYCVCVSPFQFLRS
jgi:hypothetical protein